MIPIVDLKYLRSSGYSLKVPFRFQLTSENGNNELVCTDVARILPGKRLVCFGDINDRQVVVKFYLDPAGAKRHFSRELKGVNAFQDSGIKTPELLYAGKPGSAYVLCFQRIVPSEDLFEAWEKQTDDEQRIQLLSKAVAVVADQHEAGLKQNDLHRENFLLSREKVYSIDGDAVDVRHMGKPVPAKKSLQNLALFFTHLYPHHTHLIPDVFKVYTEKRKWRFTDKLYGQLLKEIQRKKKDRKNEYLKKIYRECTEFMCRKRWDFFMVCNRNSYTSGLEMLLEDPDTYMASGELLKSGNSATLSLVEVDGRKIVIKRYNIKNFIHGLKRFFRPSRAWISWRNSHFLTYMVIPTPGPIALIEKRIGPFRRGAYFIAEYVKGIPLNHVLSDQTLSESDFQTIVEKVGRLIQKLINLMIVHGDTKASNFIVTKEDIKIVDLDVMREYKNKWAFRKAFKRDRDRLIKNWNDTPEIKQKFLQILTRTSE